MTFVCARLYGRRSARKRALEALGCAQRQISACRRCSLPKMSVVAGMVAARRVCVLKVIVSPWLSEGEDRGVSWSMR